jgi:hypothetical protein
MRDALMADDEALTVTCWRWLPGDDDAPRETPNLPLHVRFPGDHQYRPPFPIDWLRAMLVWPSPFDGEREPLTLDTLTDRIRRTLDRDGQYPGDWSTTDRIARDIAIDIDREFDLFDTGR